MSEEYDNDGKKLLFRICVVGDVNVGKTTFIDKIVNPEYTQMKKFVHTDYTEWCGKNEKIGNDTCVMQYWDFATQDLFNTRTKIYYENSTIIFVMIDAITLKETTECAIKWKSDINTNFRSFKTNPIILLINKIDLLTDDAKSKLNYDKFCKKYGFHSWFTISNKTGEGIQSVNNTIIKICTNFVYKKDTDDILIPKIEPELTTHTFIKSIIILFQNPFPENDVQFVLTLKRKLLTLYFSPEMDSDRKQIKSDKKLQKVVHGIHYIVVDENITDAIKLTKVLNLVMDYGKSF